jgi:hypothetical protein
LSLKKTIIFEIREDSACPWQCYSELNIAQLSVKADRVNIMGKKISPNDLAESRSESRDILEDDFIPSTEKEAVEWYLDNVEPYYFFKGAVLCLIFSLPFWIIFFRLIT